MSFAEIAKSLAASMETIAKRLAKLERTQPRDGERGPQGEPGMPGRDGRDGEKGMDGRDGLDGLGFDDLTFEYDGERTLKAVWARGDVVKEAVFTLPVPIYRGIHVLNEPYQKGDAVTKDGGTFIALKDTAELPGASQDWRLMAKRGRDGKDAVVKEAKQPVGSVRGAFQ